MSTAVLLPPELEREIFEETALMHKSSIPNLILVARRVFVWIEPLLYRVFCAILTSEKPPPFFHNAVRHLALLGDPSTSIDNLRVLGLCRGISSFGATNSNVDGAVLVGLEHRVNLRRLSMCLSLLFDPAVDFTHPIFRSLTHLDLFDSVQHGVMGLLPFIPTLPALTHLALHPSIPRDDVLGALARSPPLQVLLVLWSIIYEKDYSRARSPHVYDVRFVTGLYVRYWETWEAGATGLPDFWSLGADFVARKRRGEIEGIYFSTAYLVAPSLTHSCLSDMLLVKLETRRRRMHLLTLPKISNGLLDERSHRISQTGTVQELSTF
ncbi:hypothetical protein B0H16DRAFT_1472924 [Mycena metata]|uniref:Uncharacterized protein n=1 Tax=Mycena metata TaxID=1033252 RepID=A0AAD7HLH1_9AGAR|nr:hypothetical protein B0H16DRAFT_1472924 [Mycena metata]